MWAARWTGTSRSPRSFRRPPRVQALRALLLPQLPLRGRVEGEPAPVRPGDADRGPDPHLPVRLPGGVRRRCLDVALRDHDAGRLGGALERRTRSGLDSTAPRAFPESGLAQPGPAEALGLHPLDRDD